MRLSRVDAFIRDSKSAASDFIIFTYLRIYAYENELSPKHFEQLIQSMDNVRDKYRQQSGKVPAFVTDTFRPDMRKRVAIKHS